MIGDLISGGLKFLGGMFDNKSSEKTAAMNIAMQKEFAKNGVQWKVSDAKKAGIHPIYALGGQTHSFSPVSVGSNWSEALGGMGQDIGRAVNATQNAPDRAAQKVAQGLLLEKAGLENELLRAQIGSINARSATNPPMPVAQRYLIDGQGQTATGDVTGPATALVKDKPMERTPGQPGAMHQEPGAITDVGHARVSGGGFVPVPSADVKERIEDDLLQQVTWFIRNNLLPAFGYNESPPSAPLPDGYKWRFHPFKFQYRPARQRGRFKEWK